jgi:hypothetical protein
VPTITATVEVRRPKGRLSLGKLERAIHAAAMAAGRQGPVEALGAW